MLQKPAEQICPICASMLVRRGREFSLDELFSLWKLVEFSNKAIEEHKKQSGYTQLYVCAVCKLEIFLPQIIGMPDFYIELQNDTSGSYYVGEKWDFQEALKDAKLGGSVIEIGCGPGVFLDRVQQIAEQVVGIEYNQRALVVARNKGLTVYEADDNELDCLKGRFDTAFSFHVLEHVSNPVEFIQDMLAWIKPGGKICLSVPNMGGPVKYISPCVSNMPPHHATRWHLKTFRALSEKLGLRVIRFSYEPLVKRDYYYYSSFAVSHWLSNMLPARYLKMVQVFAANSFELIFRILAIFNKTTIRSLKGQSLYVVLSKSENDK
jgi:2-polyprenyl-3-methyl-5-hydroxy-6-metoxy-1,4-benzoquinol methylase